MKRQAPPSPSSQSRPLRRRNGWRAGMVLVLVLIVVAMLSLAGFSFSELMFIEHKGARLAGRRLQVRAVVESAAEAVTSYLGQPRELQAAVGGHVDNPEYWQGVLVLDDPSGAGQGRFCVISPAPQVDDTGLTRFGLSDESSRLNLHALLAWETRQPGAGRTALMQLPGMTIEIAEALLDWIDADDEPRESGAESEYYERLEPPVQAANAVPTVLEELLLVRGVTRSLLFGNDDNRNGSLEAHEQKSASSSYSAALTGPTSPHGWSAYLTLFSAEACRDENDQPRINLNSDDLAGLHKSLLAAFDRQLADFVIHFRQFGPAPTTARGSSATTQIPPASTSLPGPFKLGSPWDLVGATVIQLGMSTPVTISSPLSDDRDRMRQYLPAYLDRVTTTAAPAIIGRVNVNEAPREVLAGLPGINPTTADEILAKRPREGGDDPLIRHAAWLVLDDVLDLPRMRSLWPVLTGGGDVYRAQLVGYLDRAAPVERVEIVVSATSRPARVVSWRDLRALGAGYSAEVLVKEEPDSRR